MDPLDFVTLALELERRFLGREVERVQPVERTGVHVSFAGLRSGLRLDTALPGGAALAFDDGPARLRGGRGAWPALAAAADAALCGERVDALRVAPPGPVLVLVAGGRTLALAGALRQGPALVFNAPPAPPRTLPARGADDVGALREALDAARPAQELVRALRGAFALRSPGAADFSGEARRALADWPGAFVDALLALEPEAAIERAEGLAERAESGSDEAGQPLLEALARRYPAERAGRVLGARLEEARRVHAAEAKRVRRALAAVARDEERARDASALREQGEALLAAGPALEVGDDAFRVPDPRRPGEVLEIRRDPPGAAPHEVADRLFARARKERRSVEGRAQRRAFLEQRLAALEEAEALAPPRGAAPEGEGVERYEEALRALGLGAGLETRAPEPGSRTKRGAARPAGTIRVFRSPGGFEVLAGRNARQNDRLTFKVAAPDDFWMHVEDMPGSHVVVRRRDGRDPGDEDLLFAAELAAALSQAPEGIFVDVHVARRKHVRKPRGAPPGLVTVRKARTLRVRVGRAPQE